MWDKEAAILHLNEHARPRSIGRCAEYVRKAIEAGGLRLIRRSSAKDYPHSLIVAGFVAVDTRHYQSGDVIVIEPIAGHPHGHIAMFNGTHWVSDFKQSHGHYPGARYRTLAPTCTVYRYGF